MAGVFLSAHNSAMSTDRIYANPRERIEAFRFDEHVVRVFADMVARSVPGYGLLLEMISVITRQYAKPDTALYDLGCSLGASTLAMRHCAPEDSRIIAIDNAPAMIKQAQHNIAADKSCIPVELLCQDIRSIHFVHPASLVTFNLTLQFIPAEERTALLTGGALVLSEKIHANTKDDDRVLIDLHHGFKRAQGYSDMEIAQKRSALENVLIPDSVDTHIARLHKAGFSHVVPWFQCFNFVSLLAIR